jgi:hypothetical protein
MAGCPKASPPYSPLLPYISFAVGESYKEKRIVAGIEAGEDVSKLLGLHQQYHPAVVDLPGLCAKREASDSVEMEVDEQARKHNHVLAMKTTVSRISSLFATFQFDAEEWFGIKPRQRGYSD